MIIDLTKLPMSRAERRREQKESWKRWETFITFKTIYRNERIPGTWVHEDRRTPSEKLAIIDQMIHDLEHPNV